MKKNVAILVLIIAIISGLSLTAQESGMVTVNQIDFEWAISDGHMEITLKAPAEGWVSVGFNPSSVMKDADFYIAYVKNGEVFLRDDFGRGRTSHADDTKLGGTDDAVILGGEEDMGTTTVRFRIPLNSGDEYDHTFVSGEEIPVLFAYSRSDNFTGIHTGKGKKLMTFSW